MNLYNINNKKISVWSDATSIEHFNFENNIENAKNIRKNLGIENKFIVFYHGHLTIARGILECVKAMTIINDSHPDILLFLLGQGPITEKIEIE